MKDKYQFPVYEALLDPIQVPVLLLPVFILFYFFILFYPFSAGEKRLTFASQTDPKCCLGSERLSQ